MNKNYFYNKSIIYDFENNDTYVKIKIENNKIECKNKIIKKDIEDKIKKININFIIFYVSLYDYELLKKTEYSKTIDILPLNELPIYKKNNDINDFFNWYNKNFNNNEIQVMNKQIINIKHIHNCIIMHVIIMIWKDMVYCMLILYLILTVKY